MKLQLVAFDPCHAPTIVEWVRCRRDLLWLAPKTAPPLTVAKILSWHTERADPRVMLAEGQTTPAAYAELNRTKADPRCFWLGHVIVAPQRRGQGIGTAMVRELVDQAFTLMNATTASLVVFPENHAAVSCYQSCGFVVTREEHHRFRRGGPKYRLFRMDLDRHRWESLCATRRGLRSEPRISMTA